MLFGYHLFGHSSCPSAAGTIRILASCIAIGLNRWLIAEAA
jgi:hypothetical protein